MLILFLCLSTFVAGQDYPPAGNDFSLLATFGYMSNENSNGTASFQEIYFAVPLKMNTSFYVRIFDPDCGGLNDVAAGHYETNTQFSFFGGAGCLSEPSVPAMPSGELLSKALFAREKLVDDQWVSIGPFDPAEGETIEAYPGYAFFKIVVEGVTGNDGNLYSLYLSMQPDRNRPLSGGTLFQYESVYLENGRLATRSYQSPDPQNTLYPLPVKLNPISGDQEYGVSAEAVDENK
jgi:hypothetical protein